MGIKAFALGGGIGSIINSLFPVFTGAAVGAEDKEKKETAVDLEKINTNV